MSADMLRRLRHKQSADKDDPAVGSVAWCYAQIKALPRMTHAEREALIVQLLKLLGNNQSHAK
jgi:hypothetical protein